MSENQNNEKFLNLLEPELPALSRFVRAMCRNTHDAKDIISETILKALESFHKLRDESAFKSYLFTIASRHYRKSKTKLSIFSSIEIEPEIEIPDNSDSTENNFDVEFLYRMLDKLPFEQKEAIILFEINGFKISEIAELQNITESAVKSRLKRGREKLSELMTEKKTTHIYDYPNLLQNQAR